MPGAMRKMAVYLGLVEDEPYDDFEFDHNRTQRSDDYTRNRDVESDSGVDVLRVTESAPEPVGANAGVTAMRGRNWTEETMVQEPVTGRGRSTGGTHPAGSRVRQPSRTPDASPAAASAPADLGRIVTLHPRSYNDARRIGEDFRAGNAVIIDLTELPDSEAKRIVDFSAGLVFALRGSIERVTTKVFMLSPANSQFDANDARAELRNAGIAR